MAGSAWQALGSLSAAAEIIAVLLRETAVAGDTGPSLMAKKAGGTLARLGAKRLTLDDASFPVRRLETGLIGNLADGTDGPVDVAGAALLFRGDVIAVIAFPPVQLTHDAPELFAPVDLTVFGGSEGTP